MPTIRSHVPFEVNYAAMAPCVWCQGETDIRAETPFRPDLGRVPLHLFCGADIIEAFNRYRDGRVLPSGWGERIQRLADMPRLLPPGDA